MRISVAKLWMLASWIRQYSTKRTVPYVTKGKWVLPNNSQVATVEPPKVNVPKEWRKMMHLPEWKRQMFANKEKFPEGWKPPKKLKYDQMDQMRELKAANPSLNTRELGQMFKISPEAVRRILKSRPRALTSDMKEELDKRWARRGLKMGARNVDSSKLSSKDQKVYKDYIASTRKKYRPGIGKKLRDPGQLI